MLISLLIACKNRTYNLRKTLFSVIDAANASPPVEITILDYGSEDDLQSFLAETIDANLLDNRNSFNLLRLAEKKYFVAAHAHNYAAIRSHGEYLIQLDTDVLLAEDYISYIRDRLVRGSFTWMCEAYIGCLVVVKKQEFINSGGYDERFTVYGPEDKDLCARLHRRGGSFETYPGYLFHGIRTPDDEKIKYLNQSKYKSKKEMSEAMKAIYIENVLNEVMVVNVGKEWGAP